MLVKKETKKKSLSDLLKKVLKNNWTYSVLLHLFKVD
jgi:hypothetical protein